jgi:hypothetical protein
MIGSRGKMLSRDYTPMASSNGLRYTIPQVKQADTMVALLVPSAQLHCVAMEDGRIDFGTTMLRVLGSMGETQYGCSLGCYDCSLEMELVHAANRATRSGPEQTVNPDAKKQRTR